MEQMPKLKQDKTDPAANMQEADFTVLMLGQRRAGKSSVLSSMINSMEKLCIDTGFRFCADDDTKIMMKKKQSQLQNIFYLFKGQDTFSTIEGSYKDVKFSVQTNADIEYRFFLQVDQNKKKKTKDFTIKFVDVRGESMTEDVSGGKEDGQPDGGKSINEKIAQSSVLMIAIDSPALMEGKLKDGVGEYHRSVNLPDDIYNHISAADAQMREELQKDQRILPRMVLFVPLKCEKYYYGNQMAQLNQRIRRGYRNLFTFFAAHEEDYAVAITPILTLGDVIFDHYKTRTIKTANGAQREVVIRYGEEGLPSMKAMPQFPMFRFRTGQPKFSPLYCEQPLLYLLAYVNCISNMVHSQKKGGKGGLKKYLFWGAVLFLFGGLGALGIKGIQSMLKAFDRDPALKASLEKVAAHIKTAGDGYEIVNDKIGLIKVGTEK